VALVEQCNGFSQRSQCRFSLNDGSSGGLLAFRTTMLCPASVRTELGVWTTAV
jgi:hypothetical protein